MPSLCIPLYVDVIDINPPNLQFYIDKAHDKLVKMPILGEIDDGSIFLVENNVFSIPAGDGALSEPTSDLLEYLHDIFVGKSHEYYKGLPTFETGKPYLVELYFHIDESNTTYTLVQFGIKDINDYFTTNMKTSISIDHILRSNYNADKEINDIFNVQKQHSAAVLSAMDEQFPKNDIHVDINNLTVNNLVKLTVDVGLGLYTYFIINAIPEDNNINYYTMNFLGLNKSVKITKDDLQKIMVDDVSDGDLETYVDNMIVLLTTKRMQFDQLNTDLKKATNTDYIGYIMNAGDTAKTSLINENTFPELDTDKDVSLSTKITSSTPGGSRTPKNISFSKHPQNKSKKNTSTNSKKKR